MRESHCIQSLARKSSVLTCNNANHLQHHRWVSSKLTYIQKGANCSHRRKKNKTAVMLSIRVLVATFIATMEDFPDMSHHLDGSAGIFVVYFAMFSLPSYTFQIHDTSQSILFCTQHLMGHYMFWYLQ